MRNSIDFYNPKEIRKAQVQAMKNMVQSNFSTSQISEYTGLSETFINEYTLCIIQERKILGKLKKKKLFQRFQKSS